MEREILKDIWKIRELHHQIYEVMSIDDQCDPQDYADHQIINEALFVKSKYTDLSQNWELAEELHGVYGKEAQKIAKKEFRLLENWLKKYMPTVNPKLLNPKEKWYLGNCDKPLLKK